MDRHAWWQTAVMYQIYPRSFQDENGDGIGDLRGIRRRLPYLCDLGIDAVWISPIFPSPMADFGYDVSDYTAIDPLFRTLRELDALLAAAHARGLRILLDLAANHPSDRHALFPESPPARPPPHEVTPIHPPGLPAVPEVIAGLRRVVDESPYRVLIGEIYLPTARLATYYARDLEGAHLPFTSAKLDTPWEARGIAKLI